MSVCIDEMPPSEVTRIVDRLGNSILIRGAHGYKEDRSNIRIIDAAKQQAKEMLYRPSGVDRSTPAHLLMEVVLAANRDQEKHVKTQMGAVRRNYPNLTLRKLEEMLKTMDFVEFGGIWGHRNEKKYETLKKLVRAALALFPGTSMTDEVRLHEWASASSLQGRREDPFGRIPNVGIATYQHLRIAFGIDTVKPDLRVTQVLEKEFGIKATPSKAIAEVEKIARIVGLRTIEIDQIFVKYGSGYYRKVS